MKLSEGGLLLCVLATVLLTGESAPRMLNSIKDLKEVDFGRSVPKHSLLLLYWFASNININDNNIRLTFDPTTDFGSHRYYNIEGLLDQLEEGFHYYTIGNLNLNEDFPGYVRNPPDRQYEGGNLDRIVVRQDSHDDSIDGVYLTQHTPGSAEYDPDHTYQISPTLLRQIRQFSTQTITSLRQRFRSNINDQQLNTFRST
uniref:Uncharacterized protein n=1 Tax=Knipowitschia caucasica TaxID=637954 RepID=A0AAV2L5Y8_KNICA